MLCTLSPDMQVEADHIMSKAWWPYAYLTCCNIAALLVGCVLIGQSLGWKAGVGFACVAFYAKEKRP